MPGAYTSGKSPRSKRTRMIQYKEAANLGAISGPDLELINERARLGHVAHAGHCCAAERKACSNRSTSRNAIACVQRAKTMEQVYGVEGAGFDEPPVTTPPGSFSAIPQTSGGILGDTSLNPFASLIPKKP
jgi:hypothetical protein